LYLNLLHFANFYDILLKEVFIAYIPQIIANLQGNKAQPFQPLSAAISCLIWVIYGWTKEPKKDWILIIPNSAGVILGGITFLTSL